MYEVAVVGIEEVNENNSDGFNMDIINLDIKLDKEIKSITKISLSINSEYLDNFVSVDDNYVNLYVTIKSKIEYIATDLSINFKLVSINSISTVDLKKIKPSVNINTYSYVIDFGIININKNTLSIYIMYLCMVDI